MECQAIGQFIDVVEEVWRVKDFSITSDAKGRGTVPMSLCSRVNTRMGTMTSCTCARISLEASIESTTWMDSQDNT